METKGGQEARAESEEKHKCKRKLEGNKKRNSKIYVIYILVLILTTFTLIHLKFLQDSLKGIDIYIYGTQLKT